ncbi:MAG: hypothetical protein B1H04_05790 [Planctomycetales bacterium 4484_123]|nr:MAG: hypothetical protein B1H04_05790 [Planctomycetales bacterium 4484_123]
MLDGQHKPHMLPNGNLLIFDNGTLRGYSRVIELNPLTEEIEWEYTAEPKEDFFAPHISGAQRLPNVNTLICEGNKSHLFEVTPAGEIVWDFVNPYVIEGAADNIYRCLRYSPEHVRPLLAHSGQSAAGGRLVCSRAARPGGLGAAAGLGFVDWGSVHKMCAAW